MKKQIVYVLIITLMLSITGCGKEQDSSNLAESKKQIEDTSNKAKESEPSTYKYNPSNSRFKIVSVEEIDDGTINGEKISILVDNETKIMYMQTEKFQAGYGLALQVMIDKDGKPLIYNSDLN